MPFSFERKGSRNTALLVLQKYRSKDVVMIDEACDTIISERNNPASEGTGY